MRIVHRQWVRSLLLVFVLAFLLIWDKIVLFILGLLLLGLIEMVVDKSKKHSN